MAYVPILNESETLPVSTIAVGFVSVPNGVARAKCQVQDANIRVCVDGSTPTTSAGYRLYDGQWFDLFGTEIALFRAIRDDATDAAVAAAFYYGSPDPYDN